MSVKGDLASALVSKGYTWSEAKSVLNYIIEHADAPDFAIKYADQCNCDTDEQHNNKMLEYWDVIKFIKDMI